MFRKNIAIAITTLILVVPLLTSCEGSGGSGNDQPARQHSSNTGPKDNKGKPCDKGAIATGARGCKPTRNKRDSGNKDSGKPTGKKNKYGEPCTVRDPECK